MKPERVGCDAVTHRRQQMLDQCHGLVKVRHWHRSNTADWLVVDRSRRSPNFLGSTPASGAMNAIPKESHIMIKWPSSASRLQMVV